MTAHSADISLMLTTNTIPVEELSPTPNQYLNLNLNLTAPEPPQIDTVKGIQQLIEELTCLRLLWQDLKNFEPLRKQYSPDHVEDVVKLRQVQEFVTNFKSAYQSTIVKARVCSDRLESTGGKWEAIALITHISSAWQPYAKVEQENSELERLMRSYETVGDSIAALVLSEYVLSSRSLKVSDPKAREASEKLLDLYDIFVNLLLRAMPRLDLDVDMCVSVSPILHRAVRLGNAQVYNALLGRGADIKSQDYLSRTVLHVAAEANAIHVLKELSVPLLRDNSLDLFRRSSLVLAVQSKEVEVLKHLLSVQGVPRREDACGPDPLTVAAETGLIKATRLLLVEVDIYTTPKYARNAGLKVAASKGHLEIVRLLVTADAELNDTEDSLGIQMTALCSAAQAGQFEVVRYLLQVKANVNVRSSHPGMPLLHGAAANGDGHIAQMLLRAGAYVDCMPRVRDEGLAETCTALELASAKGHYQIVRLLLGSKATIHQALEIAARNGHLDVVNLLLDHRANIIEGCSKCSGTTPLLEAVSGGHLSVVKTLLKAKANVEASCRLIYHSSYYILCRSLHLAAYHGLTDIVEALLDMHANDNATNGMNNADEGENSTDEESDEQIALAADGGHLRTVKLLISAGANVNATSPSFGGTALQVAASEGHSNVVQVLLQANANVNAPTSEDGQTALQFAADGGHLEIVRLLLDAKADVNGRPFARQHTPLQAATANGDIEIVRLLLSAGATVNAIPAYDLAGGHTALQGATRHEHLELTQLLLDANADVNAIHPFSGNTALQVAASHGRVEVVGLLLSASADPNSAARGDSGMTALQGAAHCGNLGLVELLLKAGADANGNPSACGTTALSAAVEANCEDVVQLLLFAAANVNAVTNSRYGGTALHVAARKGYRDIAQQLLFWGADVNKRNLQGLSTLTVAAGGGDIVLVDLLLSAQANLNACSGATGQSTPLEAAVSAGSIAITKRLLLAGADVSIGNPLASAARTGHSEMVRLLLSNNADVNPIRDEGCLYDGPALVCAAYWQHREVVQMLLDAGTKHDIIEVALPVAAGQGDLEIVQLLLGANLNCNALHTCYPSALGRAAERGHSGIVRLLLLAGTNPNTPPRAHTYDDRSALEKAVDEDQLEVVRLLLLAGADIHPPSTIYHGGQTLLQVAQSNGNPQVLQLLQSAGIHNDWGGSLKRKSSAAELDETSSSEVELW
ncbi:MAG: Ankyrin repeat domain-containing protein 44 [Pleopsidium flavum]|nr:MAG: Ankyrin repeat domain-containing protein 44 [Pleopsidium flavum]